MAKRYQVFVSSTYEDLRDERDFVIKAILDMGHIPVGMELFSAADEEQWQTIKREIDNSDYYLVIVAHRYGTIIEEEGGISYTEKEYDYAVAQGVPRIGFVISRDADWKRNRIDDGDKAVRLEAFKVKVKGRPVDFWGDKQQLATRVAIALPKLIANTDRPGWERGTEGGKQVAETISRLSDENARLQAELDRLKAQAGDNVPTLDCYFIGQNGEAGDTLFFKPEPLLTVQEHGKASVRQLNSLVEHLNELQRTTPSGKQAQSIYTSALRRDYRFDQHRIVNVVTVLRAVGAKRPTSEGMWTFENLEQDMASIAYPVGAGLYYEPPEPVAGRDLEKYRAFKMIENQVNSIRNAVESHNYRQTHIGVQLRLTNVSTTAAEGMTVRLDFSEDVSIGLFELDAQRRREAEEGVRYEEEIALLPPEDSVVLKPCVVEISQDVSEVAFNVRITGKNLPKAQIIPMRIVVGEPPVAEAAPEA